RRRAGACRGGCPRCVGCRPDPRGTPPPRPWLAGAWCAAPSTDGAPRRGRGQPCHPQFTAPPEFEFESEGGSVSMLVLSLLRTVCNSSSSHPPLCPCASTPVSVRTLHHMCCMHAS